MQALANFSGLLWNEVGVGYGFPRPGPGTGPCLCRKRGLLSIPMCGIHVKESCLSTSVLCRVGGRSRRREDCLQGVIGDGESRQRKV